jgi:hypothetical protein
LAVSTIKIPDAYSFPSNSPEIGVEIERVCKVIDATATHKIVVLKPIIDKLRLTFSGLGVIQHVKGLQAEEYWGGVYQLANYVAQGTDEPSITPCSVEGYWTGLRVELEGGAVATFGFKPRNAKNAAVRLEFNPSRLSPAGLKSLFAAWNSIEGKNIHLAAHLTSARVSRCDVALDVLNLKLADLFVHSLPYTPYLRIDTHIAASLMQKAIRRSETDWALKAGQRLFDVQPARFWRRVSVTLFEDVGLLDRQLALDVLACAPRRGASPICWSVAAHLIGRLCEATKTQVANNLLHLGRYDLSEAEPMVDFDLLPFANAECWITGDTATTAQRAKAIWQLSGIGCSGQVVQHPEADRERVLSILSGLAGDPVLEIIAREGLRLTGHILPMVSVLEEAVNQEKGDVTATADPMPPEERIGGLPGLPHPSGPDLKLGPGGLCAAVMPARPQRRAA